MILIIDDERYRMSMMKKNLEGYGYDVTLIDSLEDATNFIHNNSGIIDVIILDIMMPWNSLFNKDDAEFGLVSGYLFYKDIIRKTYGYNIPVIVYTAINKPNVLNELTKEKNCKVLLKPDRISNIIKYLNEFNIYPTSKSII
jgi:CheY-like chemotaxis protein